MSVLPTERLAIADSLDGTMGLRYGTVPYGTMGLWDYGTTGLDWYGTGLLAGCGLTADYYLLTGLQVATEVRGARCDVSGEW